MRSTGRLAAFVLLAASAALFAGCASQNSPTAIMDRVDANRAEYEAWPLAIKEAVLDGRVLKGMDKSMVYVARGKPTEVVDRGGGDEVWVYHKSGGGSSSPMGGSRGSISIGGGPGGVYVGGSPTIPIMTPGPAPYEPVDEDVITFRNGLVTRGDGVEKR